MQSQQDTFMRLLRLRQLVADLSNVTHRKEDISANVVAISLCAAPSDLSPAQEMAAQQLMEIHKAIAVIDKEEKHSDLWPFLQVLVLLLFISPFLPQVTR